MKKTSTTAVVTVLTVISFILAIILIAVTFAGGIVTSVRTAYSSSELGDMLARMDYADIEIFVDGKAMPLYEVLNNAIEKYSGGKLKGEFTARIVNSQLEKAGVTEVLAGLGEDLGKWLFEGGSTPKLNVSTLAGNIFDNLDGETMEILRSQNITGDDVNAIVKRTVGDIDLGKYLEEADGYRVFVSRMAVVILWASVAVIAALLFLCGRLRPEIAAFYFGASWTIGGILLLIVKFVISVPLKMWVIAGKYLPESTYNILTRPFEREVGRIGEFFVIAGAVIIIIGLVILMVKRIVASVRKRYA